MTTAAATPWKRARKTHLYKAVSAALWRSNPISKLILGVCSALAVTVQLKTAIVMGLALTFVVAFSNLAISMMRPSIASLSYGIELMNTVPTTM